MASLYISFENNHPKRNNQFKINIIYSSPNLKYLRTHLKSTISRHLTVVTINSMMLNHCNSSKPRKLDLLLNSGFKQDSCNSFKDLGIIKLGISYCHILLAAVYFFGSWIKLYQCKKIIDREPNSSPLLELQTPLVWQTKNNLHHTIRI